MSALIILVNSVSRTLRHTEAVLSERGHLVAALTSYAEASNLLDSVTPDLLVVDARLGASSGLQLALRSLFDHPDVPVIVTSARPDAEADAESTRCGAAFVVRPLENPAFLRAVDAAIERRRREQPAIRRWFRNRTPGVVEVRAAEEPAHLIDLSYGGVRLAFKQPVDVPPVFDISIPPAGVSVRAQRVWTAPSATGDSYFCGAALLGDVDDPWRQFIESLRSATS